MSLTCLGGALLLTRRAPVIFVASDQADFMTGETVYVGPRVSNRED